MKKIEGGRRGKRYVTTLAVNDNKAHRGPNKNEAHAAEKKAARRPNSGRMFVTSP